MPESKDDQTYARFYIHPSVDGNASAQANKNIYKDVIMAEVFIKGSRNTSSSHIKTDEDEERFSREWNEFLTGEEVIDGTPLSALPGLGPSAEMNFKSQGIVTVEDLANLSDGVVLGTPGMVEMRKRALAYLAAMEPERGEANENLLMDEINALKAEIEAMKSTEKPKRKRRKRNPETGELE